MFFHIFQFVASAPATIRRNYPRVISWWSGRLRSDFRSWNYICGDFDEVPTRALEYIYLEGCRANGYARTALLRVKANPSVTAGLEVTNRELKWQLWRPLMIEVCYIGIYKKPFYSELISWNIKLYKGEYRLLTYRNITIKKMIKKIVSPNTWIT